MSKSYKVITEDLSNYLSEVKEAVPDVMKGFSDMAKAATQDGVLDKKTKELVALAIGIAVRCDGCIGFHTKTLVRLGATRKEVEEICGISVYMGGGPSLMYAADALRAFDEFANKA